MPALFCSTSLIHSVAGVQRWALQNVARCKLKLPGFNALF